MSSNDWYIKVTTPELEQGDILFDFPVIASNLSKEEVSQLAHDPDCEISVDIKKIDVIVMTQSCDLANEKVESVILCPMWDIDEVANNVGTKEQIRKGFDYRWHILNRFDDENISYKVVEFMRLYSADKQAVINFADKITGRLRLQSPYKEHLSQSFARYFMRVGLPSNIPSFKSK